MQVSSTLHFKGSKWYIDILNKKLSNKAWLISTVLNIVLELDWQKSNWEFFIFKLRSLKIKNTRTVVLREIQWFGLQLTAFFRLVTRLKHGSSVIEGKIV